MRIPSFLLSFALYLIPRAGPHVQVRTSCAICLTMHSRLIETKTFDPCLLAFPRLYQQGPA